MGAVNALLANKQTISSDITKLRRNRMGLGVGSNDRRAEASAVRNDHALRRKRLDQADL
jgi:hypothetical protein